MAATIEMLERDIPEIQSVEKGSNKWVDLMNDAIWNAGVNTVTDISICDYMLVVAHDSGYSCC